MVPVPVTQWLQVLISLVGFQYVVVVIVFTLNLLHLPIIIPTVANHVHTSTTPKWHNIDADSPLATKVTLCLEVIVLNETVVMLGHVYRIRRRTIVKIT